MLARLKSALKKCQRFVLRPLYRRFAEIDRRIDLLRNEMIVNYLTMANPHENPEQKSIAAYLTTHPLAVFPYGFVQQHREADVAVFTDAQSRMKYVEYENKRLYYPREWDKEKIRSYHNWLLIEQDEKSPHRYETENFHVRDGEIVADIGAAEGIFTLSIIEKAKKVYLFECEKIWLEALKQTFAPWREKIEIVNKYIADQTDDNRVTLDDFFFATRKINFIKADIEGAEIALLKGATKTLATVDNLRLLLCAYHRQNDAAELQQLLAAAGFATEFSAGYMIYHYDPHFAVPYLRRALLRAAKGDKVD